MIAGWQAFGPAHPEGSAPVNVTLTVPQQAAAAPRTDADLIATDAVNLAEGASFSPADKGDSSRYPLGDLFDGKAETFITLGDADNELNVMINFPGDAAREVTAISYMPPPGVAPNKLATSVDVMVLPDADAGAAGHPVYSFTLPTSPGLRTFAIPGHNVGRAVWLRVAGNPDVKGLVIGDFGILREHITP